MLRALVAALLIANLAYWAWHWPPFAQPLGRTADAEREPQRMDKQVQPDRVRLLVADDAARPSRLQTDAAPALVASSAAGPAASAPAGAVCLEAGPLDEAAFNMARRDLQLAGVAADAWVDMRRERPGSAGLVMGRFADTEQMRRKTDELQRMGITPEVVTSGGPPGLAPGLILERFATSAQAQARLQQLQARGVRTARVLTLVTAATEHTLRLDNASPEQRGRLLAQPLATALNSPAPTSPWRACAAP
jgi:hypothetical protein